MFWFSGNWTIGVCRLALCSALRAGVFEAWQVFQSDEIGEWDGALIVRPIPVPIVSMSLTGVSLGRLRSRRSVLRFAR